VAQFGYASTGKRDRKLMPAPERKVTRRILRLRDLDVLLTRIPISEDLKEAGVENESHDGQENRSARREACRGRSKARAGMRRGRSGFPTPAPPLRFGSGEGAVFRAAAWGGFRTFPLRPEKARLRPQRTPIAIRVRLYFCEMPAPSGAGHVKVSVGSQEAGADSQ
jgi:hypothetical protein